MNNFTLIIPTHNRHYYLKRSIIYFKDLKATVIYCDSSNDKYDGYFADNMKYVHMPGISFVDKIYSLLEVVESKFVCFCADDDFILIDSLYKGCLFLNNNIQFKTVVGKYISFKESFDGIYYPMYDALPDDINYSNKENISTFFKNYYQILWAMYDKSLLINSFEILKQARFKNENFIELVIGAFACHEGGIKFLNEIWGIREISIKEHWGNKHLPIINMDIALVGGDYYKFENLVDSKTFQGCASLIMNSYFIRHSNMNNNKIKNCLLKLIPKSIKRRFREFLNKNSVSSINLESKDSQLLEPISLLLANHIN